MLYALSLQDKSHEAVKNVLKTKYPLGSELSRIFRNICTLFFKFVFMLDFYFYFWAKLDFWAFNIHSDIMIFVQHTHLIIDFLNLLFYLIFEENGQQYNLAHYVVGPL